MAMLKMKEAKIVELEAGLDTSKSIKEDSERTKGLQQEKCREMETDLDLEGLFRQKIEAEVEYMAISRTILQLRVAAVDQITLLEEQKTLALGQAQMRQAEELETYREDIVEVDDVMRLQKRFCKITLCFFIQLMLLFLTLGLLFLKLSPHNAGMLPT
ncbi:unnamed protein product [Ilex paraguariensis]|uniref:Uncharacterized protein n=1 Tax=Ilex paraguariensis TaxID=185542 RepID=A0ABC8S154_9AQUA